MDKKTINKLKKYIKRLTNKSTHKLIEDEQAKQINLYLNIIAKRITPKVNENDIKTIIPIVMPISKEIIGYLNV